MRRAGRQRELLVSGVVDSFGMALGWTVIILMATSRGGLAEAALYNAAMLGGVVLSAPVTGWLSRRMNGRTLLRSAACVEMVLRLAVLWGLVAGAPSELVALGIAAMHVAAWAGFAGMRAEVTAVDASPRAMTKYAVSIAGVEATGTALAALLPTSAAGHPTGWLLGTVFAIYLGSLVPTILTARRARITPDGPQPYPAGTSGQFGSVPRIYTHAEAVNTRGLPTPSPVLVSAAANVGASVGFVPSPTGAHVAAVPGSAGRRRAAIRGRHAAPTGTPETRRMPSPRLLIAGGAVMLIAAGPTLLAVPLTAELHGAHWVAGAAVAFSLGTLLSTSAVAIVGRLQLPAVLRWSLWGLGMLAGWILAPLFAPMVLVAQFVAGLCQTAFEGDMDARVAAEARPAAVTRDLAYSASIRALGGSISVRLLPLLVTASAIGTAASVAALLLGITTVIIWAGLTLAPHLFRRLAH